VDLEVGTAALIKVEITSQVHCNCNLKLSFRHYFGLGGLDLFDLLAEAKHSLELLFLRLGCASNIRVFNAERLFGVIYELDESADKLCKSFLELSDSLGELALETLHKVLVLLRVFVMIDVAQRVITELVAEIRGEQLSFSRKAELTHELFKLKRQRLNQLLVNDLQMAVHLSHVQRKRQDLWVELVLEIDRELIVVPQKGLHGAIIVNVSVELAEDTLRLALLLEFLLEEVRPGFQHLFNRLILLLADAFAVLCKVNSYCLQVR